MRQKQCRCCGICLLGASVRWLPPKRQQHASANPRDFTLSLLVTTHDHIYNPFMHICSGYYIEPYARHQVSDATQQRTVKTGGHHISPASLHECVSSRCTVPWLQVSNVWQQRRRLRSWTSRPRGSRISMLPFIWRTPIRTYLLCWRLNQSFYVN